MYSLLPASYVVITDVCRRLQYKGVGWVGVGIKIKKKNAVIPLQKIYHFI